MKYEINPLKLDAVSDRTRLHAVLHHYRDKKIWKPHFLYHMPDYTVELTHYLILMPTNNGDAPKYQVVSPYVMFESEKARLSPIACELSFSNVPSVTYSTSPSMIVKFQWSTLSANLFPLFSKNKQHEFDCANEVGYLGATQIINTAYNIPNTTQQWCESAIVMERMPGIDLFDFIETYFPSANIKIPIAMRMRLTIEILRAFQKQVYQLGLYHGDLKPENMILDLGIGDDMLPIKLNDQHIRHTKINIIDFAGSQHFGEVIEHFSCTQDYCAPERITATRINGKNVAKVINTPVLNEKPDMFSIGIIIGLVWGIKQILPSDNDKLEHFALEMHRKYFATGPMWFTAKDVFLILYVIQHATNKNPALRMSLDDAIWVVEDLINNTFKAHCPGLFPSFIQSSDIVPDIETPNTSSIMGDTQDNARMISGLRQRFFSSNPLVMDEVDPVLSYELQ